MPHTTPNPDFFEAVRKGDATALSGLLAQSDAKATNLAGWTALMIAAALGHAECVELLLPVSDAAATSTDTWGWTALTLAATQGHADCLQLLLSASDARATLASGKTALMCAAGAGHAECVELLLPFIDPKATDHQGWTALMLASAEYPACVRLLLPVSDASVRSTHKTGQGHGVGWTALMNAALAGCAECVELLLAASDAKALDTEGRAAIVLATRDGPNLRPNHDGYAACADLLAEQSERADADAAFAVFTRARMPRWGSIVEAEALRATIAPAAGERPNPAPTGSTKSARRI